MDFHGEKRSNETHESTTDPEAKLARKGNGKEAKLSYSAHALMENRNGLAGRSPASTRPTATPSDEAALADARRGRCRASAAITLGADKGYDTRDFVADVPRAQRHAPRRAERDAAPRLRRSTRARRATPATRSASGIRKRVEEIFGWVKTVGNFRRTRYRGRARTQLAAYIRRRRLQSAAHSQPGRCHRGRVSSPRSGSTRPLRLPLRLPSPRAERGGGVR